MRHVWEERVGTVPVCKWCLGRLDGSSPNPCIARSILASIGEDVDA